MTGKVEFDLLGRPALDRDGLLDDLHLFKAALVAISPTLSWDRLDLVDVEILLIDVEDGDPKGGLVVVPKGDARQSGFAGPDD